jgi:endonuclease-3
LDKVNHVISLLEEEFPGDKPRQGNGNPLDVLIATMLSQNTTDKTSYKAFLNLKKNFKNWDGVMNAPLSKIRDAIKVCGLANQKSKSIKNLLKQLKKKYGRLSLGFITKMDNEKIYKELLHYSGIGLKTVSCVLAFGLGRDVFPVDTHVHRVTNRLGLADAKTPDKTYLQMNDKIPPNKKFLFHTLLIRFGRKICRANNPLCGKCRLYDLCIFGKKEFYASALNGLPKENNFIILENV